MNEYTKECGFESTYRQANQEVRSLPVEQISCIDLFCGVGGLTHGLIQGGIRVLAGIDSDSQCRFSYEKNNGANFIEKDVQDVNGSDINQLFGDAKWRLLAGCAPCQPFSAYSQKKRRQECAAKLCSGHISTICLSDSAYVPRASKEWQLVSDFGRLVHESQPDFVTMENVPQLIKHPVFQDLLKHLKGYSTWWGVVNCAQYGVPQNRKRLVLLASKLGKIELLPAQLSSLDDFVTVRKAISHLPPLTAGSQDPADPLHRASSLSPLNLRRIQASKPGGSWRDWHDSLRAACHRQKSGQTFPSVYGRMQWDAPAPTITTQFFGFGNGRFGHPEQDRALSLREGAILQTFPEDYCFVAPSERVSLTQLGRFIGNAVPPKLGEWLAKSLLNHLLTLR